MQSKSLKELSELVEKLPKDVIEYMRNLIGSLTNSKKKEKKEVKKKDEQESRKGKRSKGKEKGKKKTEEEAAVDEVEETKELTFFDYFKQVTDYGGPLFKSYDRTLCLFCAKIGKQLKQMLHANKVELQQKLELVVLQTAGEEELLQMASLVMNLNYGLIPFVPSLKVGELKLFKCRKRVACFWSIIRKSLLCNW